MLICLASTVTCAQSNIGGGGGVWQNQGTNLGTPGTINCSTNLTCTFSNGLITIVASSSAATAFSGITAATNSNAGTFAATGNVWDFSGATSFKVPIAAGAVPTASGLAAYDSTNNKWVFGQNGATVGFGLTSSACGVNTFVNTPATSTAAASCAQPTFSNLSGSIALAQTPLTTRGDLLVVNSTPALARLSLGSANLYIKSNGTDTVYSTLAAGGVGTCTNQVVITLNADAAPSCTNITQAMISNNAVGASQLTAQYSKGSCTEAWGGSGASHALTSGDDAVVNNSCYNDSGVTRTITAVKCRSDNASNTTTVNPTFGSAGTGTTILSAALTCGSSYAYSSSGTVSNASWTTGTGIDPAMAGTLTGTSIAVIVEYTF